MCRLGSIWEAKRRKMWGSAPVTLLLAAWSLCLFDPLPAHASRISKAERYCRSESLVGFKKEFKATLDAKASQLESAKVELGTTASRSLSQQLEDFSTRWEFVYRSLGPPCKDYALCQHFPPKGGGDTDCQVELERWDEKQREGRQFIFDLERLQIGRPSDGSSPLPTRVSPPQEKGTPDSDKHENWPGEVYSFDDADSGWRVDSGSEEEVDWEWRLVGARYRWDMRFHETWVKYLESPEGSATDFFAAVDIVFSEYGPENIVSAGLLFGHVGGVAGPESYQLFVSTDKTWALSRAKGPENSYKLFPVPVAIDIQQVTRLGVVVEDGDMRFYLNEHSVGEFRDADFNGGDVGLLVGGNPGEVTVEFDRFELRRKPRK